MEPMTSGRAGAVRSDRKEPNMLSQNEQEVLTRGDIVQAYKLVGEYKIYLEWANDYQFVKFRIYERPDGRFEFEQSHYIKTPDQASHYVTSRTAENDADYALKRGVGTIMDYYSLAVQKGQQPKKTWFVPNKDF